MQERDSLIVITEKDAYIKILQEREQELFAVFDHDCSELTQESVNTDLNRTFIEISEVQELITLLKNNHIQQITTIAGDPVTSVPLLLSQLRST